MMCSMKYYLIAIMRNELIPNFSFLIFMKVCVFTCAFVNTTDSGYTMVGNSCGACITSLSLLSYINSAL